MGVHRMPGCLFGKKAGSKLGKHSCCDPTWVQWNPRITATSSLWPLSFVSVRRAYLNFLWENPANVATPLIRPTAAMTRKKASWGDCSGGTPRKVGGGGRPTSQNHAANFATLFIAWPNIWYPIYDRWAGTVAVNMLMVLLIMMKKCLRQRNIPNSKLES